jgi:hypothetical protein
MATKNNKTFKIKLSQCSKMECLPSDAVLKISDRRSRWRYEANEEGEGGTLIPRDCMQKFNSF